MTNGAGRELGDETRMGRWWPAPQAACEPFGLRVGFWLFCLPFSVDYRSFTGKMGLFQIALYILSNIGFLFVMMSACSITLSKKQMRLAACWGLLIVFTSAVAMLRSVGLENWARTTINYLTFAEAFLVGGYIQCFRKGDRTLFHGLMLCSVISTFWTAFYSLVLMRMPIDEARWTMLSPLAIVLMACCVCMICFRGAIRGWLALLGVIIAAVAFIISLTRATLLVCAVAAIVSMLVARNRDRALMRRKAKLRLAMLLLAAVGGIVGLANTGLMGHWGSRLGPLTTGVNDPTAVTRIAEASGEYEVIKSDLSHVLFGSGLGAPHYWDSTYRIGRQEFQGSGGVEFDYVWTAPGHIAYIYEFFASGIILGFVLPVTIVACFLQGVRRNSSEYARCGATGAAAIASYSFLGHVLGTRAGAMGCGLVMALCFSTVPVVFSRRGMIGAAWGVRAAGYHPTVRAASGSYTFER